MYLTIFTAERTTVCTRVGNVLLERAYLWKTSGYLIFQ